MIRILLFISIVFFHSAAIFGVNADSSRVNHQYQKLMNLADDEQFSLLERKLFAGKAIDLAKTEKDALKIINSLTRYGYIIAQEGNYSEAFHVFSEVRSISDSLGYETKDDWRRKAFFLNIEGILYKELGIYDRSLKAYYESLRICDSVDWKSGQTTVLNNISNLFLLQGDYYKALELQHKSFQISRIAQDTLKIYDALFNLMVMHGEQSNLDSAFYYAERCESILPSLMSVYQECFLILEKAKLHLNSGKIIESKALNKKALQISSQNNFYELIVLANKGLGDVYLKEKRFDIAENPFKKALLLTDSLKLPKLRTDLLFELSGLKENRGEITQAYLYLKEAQQLKDSLNKSWRSIQQSELHQIYELQWKEQENKLLENNLSIAQLKIERRNTVILGVILLLIASIWILSVVYRKRKFEKKMIEEVQTRNQTIHLQEKLILEQKEEHLKAELSHKTRQLATYSLSSIKHVMATEEIITKISQLIYNEPIKASTKRELEKVIQQMKRDLIKSDWEEFKTYYQQVHPSFYENLLGRHPDLSANDEKLCAFISLGLSTKDIASLTFRQVRSVESARLRLRRKLGLNQNDSIFDYLKAF